MLARYDDQLTQVAYLGRLATPQVLAKLVGMVSTASAGLMAQVDAAGAIDMANWAICSEQMHWIVLLSGFLLTDSDKEEEETVPPEIMKASGGAASAAGVGAAGDPVVGMCSTLLGLLATCAAKAGTPQAERVSGVVLGDLLWWATRWAKAYLLLDDAKYGDELSASLVANFGADSAGANAAMGTLITAACQALLGWPGDLDVAEPAAELLAALTKGATKTALALKSPNVRGLANQFRLSDSPLALLSVELQTQIALALCRTFSAASAADRQAMFQHIIQPMHTQFKATLGSANATTAQTPGVKRMVLRYLYVLRGVAAAFSAKTAALYFSVFAELLGPLAGVVKLYSTSPEVGEVVLRLVADLIEKASPLLPGAQKGALFQAATAVLQQYAAAYGGGVASASESDQVHVLLDVLSLIAEAVMFQPRDESSPVQVSAVLLSGVQTLPTVVKAAMLLEPELCFKFFEVVQRVTSECAAELYTAEALTAGIVGMLRTGIAGADQVARRAATALVSICTVHTARVREGRGSTVVAAAVAPLMDLLVRTALLEKLSSSVAERIGQALHASICVDPARFKSIAGHLVSKADEVNRPHVTQGFATLMEGAMPLVIDRTGQRRFKEALKVFFRSCKGLLVA